MINYNRDLVIAKIKKSFPNENQKIVLDILNLYKSKERERVQIAIIKLSRNNIERLNELVRIAGNDYRDVLGLAEYPEEMSYNISVLNEIELKIIRERDLKQYIDWLNN